MSVSNVSAASISNQDQSNTQLQVQVTLERQANNIQEAGALALLQALPQPQSYTNPVNLGNGVDVQA